MIQVSEDLLVKWRRERDSNPRYGFPYSGFQDRLFQPLTHPSAESVCFQSSSLSTVAKKQESRTRVESKPLLRKPQLRHPSQC
jgi:hypothetical protein